MGEVGVVGIVLVQEGINNALKFFGIGVSEPQEVFFHSF